MAHVHFTIFYIINIFVFSLYKPTASKSNYINDWAHVRGVNYVPSYSRNPLQTWMDYKHDVIDRELGFAESIGMNTVRMFLHLFAWYNNKTVFLERYDHFIATCHKRSISPLIVLFDDDFIDAPNVSHVSQINDWIATEAYKQSKWLTNPGMPILKDDAIKNWALTTEFVMDVAGGIRANDPRILGYDIMNEPHREATWPGGLPDFISQMFYLTGNISNVLTTIDKYQKAPQEVEQLERGLSYHSYWNYGHWDQCLANTAQVCRDQASRGTQFVNIAISHNKPVLVSEMGQFNCYCPAAQGFSSVGVGWIAWELMLEHDQFNSFQGLVYKNGTFRSNTEKLCLKKLSNISHNIACPPLLPVYPGPDGCGKNNCTIIPDTNTTFLHYIPSSTPIMHSCWTAWNGKGPSETHGSLHYCNKPGSVVTFIVGVDASVVDLIYKSGPDCGMMNITVRKNGGEEKMIFTNFDTYADNVNWETIVKLDDNITKQSTFTITVSDQRNPKSSNSYIQIVSVNVFTNYLL